MLPLKLYKTKSGIRTMPQSFDTFCNEKLSSSESQLLKTISPDFKGYPKKIIGTKAAFLLALIFSGQDESCYQDAGLSPEEIASLNDPKFTSSELDTLLELADIVIDRIPDKKGKKGPPLLAQEKRTLKKNIPLLERMRASYTRLYAEAKKDIEYITAEKIELADAFAQACLNRDIDFLAWFYCEAYREYFDEEYQSKGNNPEPNSGNITSLASRKQKKDNPNDLTKEELEVQEKLWKEFSGRSSFTTDDIVNLLGIAPTYTKHQNDEKDQTRNMELCGIIIPFIRSLEQEILKITESSASPSKKVPSLPFSSLSIVK